MSTDLYPLLLIVPKGGEAVDTVWLKPGYPVADRQKDIQDLFSAGEVDHTRVARTCTTPAGLAVDRGLVDQKQISNTTAQRYECDGRAG